MVQVTDLASYLPLMPDMTQDAATLKVLDTCLSAAKQKAKAAGIPEYENNAQYDLFILSLAAMYYDNRGFTFGGSYQATAEANARKMINAFVLELRYQQEASTE